MPVIKTVGELEDALIEFDRRTPIVTMFDSFPAFDVNAVELVGDVVVIDCCEWMEELKKAIADDSVDMPTAARLSRRKNRQ